MKRESMRERERWVGLITCPGTQVSLGSEREPVCERKTATARARERVRVRVREGWDS